MLGNRKSRGAVTPEVAVKGALRDLGSEHLTYGCSNHEFFLSMFGIFPLSFVNPMMFRVMTGALERQ